MLMLRNWSISCGRSVSLKLLESSRVLHVQVLRSQMQKPSARLMNLLVQAWA